MPLLKDVRADDGRRAPRRDAAGYAIPSMRLIVVRTMPGSVPLGGRSRRGACGPKVLLGARPARCVPVARCARCVFPFGARRQCTASDGRGPRWMRPAGRSSPGRRRVCASPAWSVSSSGQSNSQLLFPFLVARQVRTTSLPSTRRLMASMISFVESLGVGLVDLAVQVEGVHGGVAVQQGEQRQLQGTVRAAAGFQEPAKRWTVAGPAPLPCQVPQPFVQPGPSPASGGVADCPTSTTRRLPRVTPV